MRINLAWIRTFLMAAAATALITVNAYGDSSRPSIVTAELLAVLVIHAAAYLRLLFTRELLYYLAFLGYALLSLAWTDNVKLAMITMPSLVNFTIVMILYGSMAAFHGLRPMLAGMAIGVLASAVLYTLTSGFPFHYPENFSYNTIAGMYLFALYCVTVYSALVGMTIVPIAVGAILLVLIAATTSIKTNLGAALGIFGSAALYFKRSVGSIVRVLLVVGVLGVAIAYALTSNPELTERVRNGLGRVALGVAVLTNREGDSGSTGLGNRKGWEREGLKGWAVTPVFGHGVEAFRADFGITSHSTPIDLLYNSGLIGAGLFYAMFASLVLRLGRARDVPSRPSRARIAMFVIAYGFISLSATLYYDLFLAMFVATSSAMLERLERGAATHLSMSAGLARPVESSLSST